MTGASTSRQPPRRPPLLAQGLLAALLAGVLALSALPGAGLLAAVVLVLQALLVLAVLALVEAPDDTGIVVVGGATALAADVVALRGDGDVGGLAGVVAVGLLAAFAVQFVRADRDRVTEALADTVLVVLLACAASCLIALRAEAGGREALAGALAAAGAALLAGRFADRLAPRPRLAVGATRGWPGLVLGLVGGVAGSVGAAALLDGDDVPGPRAALLGLAVSAAVAAADLVVDLAAAELHGTGPQTAALPDTGPETAALPGTGPAEPRAVAESSRRLAALRPVVLLLPFAAAGPVALVAGRLALT